MSQQGISRRRFLHGIGGSTAIFLTLGPRGSFAQPLFRSVLDRVSPVDRSGLDGHQHRWFGDDPTRPHDVLWQKPQYIASLRCGRLPKPTEKVPLVIIGGGLSGLSCAYLLRKHRPIVLEQASRFGGNAKGGAWHGIDYSLGAAYFIIPEEESPIGKFVHEIGLQKRWTVKGESEAATILHGKQYSAFWEGQSAPRAKTQFQQVARFLTAMNNEDDGLRFPDIPVEDPGDRPYINALDRISLIDHLRTRVHRNQLHPHIESAIEYYCWSSFGGSSSEISAASGLNFLASEFGEVAVMPGGNAGATDAILHRLAADVPLENLRVESLVYDVQVVDDGVHVAYQDAWGHSSVIHAQAVIMASPKFVAAKLIDDLEPSRKEAILKLRYRSYIVANVLLKKKPPGNFYDLFLLGEGKGIPLNLQTASQKQGATDVVLANFSSHSDTHAVLTLYRAFPYDGARPMLFLPDSYELHRGAFEAQISDCILPLLGISPQQVEGLVLSRWGHALPLAAKNLIADGVVDMLHAPYKERVFFVEQDNWALPAFETAVTEAIRWSPEVSRLL